MPSSPAILFPQERQNYFVPLFFALFFLLPVQTKETAYALNDLFTATSMFSYVNPQSQIHTKMAKEICV